MDGFEFVDNGKFILPNDLLDFFLSSEIKDGYDENLFRFCSRSDFKSINDELKNWSGLPDYRNIIHTLLGYENYFVFADYSFHLITYAIRLYPHPIDENEVISICGDEYKQIANSFSDFWGLYLQQSDELFNI